MLARFSTRDRQRVAYDVSEPTDARTATSPPTGPAVVLLHDLLGQRASMAALRDRLPASTSVSVDLRGHGASATISGASVALRELALDVAAVLDQERIPAAVVVGHGLGAAVARSLASARPDLVVALVAILPPPIAIDGSPLTESDRRAADLSYKGVVDAALDAYLAPRLGPAWRDTLPRPAIGAIRRHAPALALLIPALAAEPTVQPQSIRLTRLDGPHIVLDAPAVNASASAVAVLLT